MPADDEQLILEAARAYGDAVAYGTGWLRLTLKPDDGSPAYERVAAPAVALTCICRVTPADCPIPHNHPPQAAAHGSSDEGASDGR